MHIDKLLSKAQCSLIAEERRTKDGLKSFYIYYNVLGSRIGRKVEKYIINPFLTHEQNKDYAKTKYIKENEKIRNYNLFLPQKHNVISKLAGYNIRRH
uniref:Uncharacterized protein n=1 Tax=Meloidogyne hapla TaxID=6305 RepID=A0A1I8BU03_MELHA